MDAIDYRKARRLALTFFGVMFPALVSAQSFEIVDLGKAYPTAISDNNTIVGGISETGSVSDQRPFVMCDGCLMLILDLLPFGVNGIAHGISSDGEYVVGGVNTDRRAFPPYTGDVGIMMHETRPLVGFMWHDGEMSALDGRALISPAYDVNDQGQAVGGGDEYGIALHPTSVAELWPDELDFDSARGSRAFGINNSGQIAGERAQFVSTEWAPLAVLWDDGIRHDLGTLPGYSTSVARAINGSGQVVGWSSAEGWSHAVIWDSGMIQNIGTLPGEESSYALDINDHRQVVGTSTWIEGRPPSPVSSNGPLGERPFLWQCEQMLDLNALIPTDSGWDLLNAKSINNGGRIVGSGIKDGELRGYMLKPVKGPGRGRNQGQGNGSPLCPGSQGQGLGRR